MGRLPMKIFDTKPKPGMPVRHSTFYKAITRMARAWETLKIYNGHVDWSNGMPTIVVDEGVAAAAGLDLSKAALGYKIDPDGDNTAEVQIYAGEIDRTTVAAAKIVVADDNFVYVRRTIANDTMLVAAAASVPADDATYKYYRLYQFTVTDSVASLKLACRPFDIEGGEAAGFTGDVTSVGAIQYSSNALQYKVKTATYSNGLLTAEPTMGDWITLFTAVTGCPA